MRGAIKSRGVSKSLQRHLCVMDVDRAWPGGAFSRTLDVQRRRIRMRLADTDKGSASQGVAIINGTTRSCMMAMRGKGKPRGRTFRHCAGACDARISTVWRLPLQNEGSR